MPGCQGHQVGVAALPSLAREVTGWSGSRGGEDGAIHEGGQDLFVQAKRGQGAFPFLFLAWAETKVAGAYVLDADGGERRQERGEAGSSVGNLGQQGLQGDLDGDSQTTEARDLA